MKLYKTYSEKMKEKYGEKVYKIPVNIKTTCPNRDGTKGSSGCIFCGDQGTGFENLSSEILVTNQIKRNIEYIGKKYKSKKFSVYFQNFTNTYLPIEELSAYTKEASLFEDVVEICYATRPDCVSDEVLDAIKKNSGGKDICIELGLQSSENEVLKIINRGHTVEEFIDATRRIKEKYGFSVCVHLILNLPWNSSQNATKCAKLINDLNADYVKLHSLYVEKNTKLCDMYTKGEISICSFDEYVDLVTSFLTNLKKDVGVQRLAARAPKEDTVFCNWQKSWWKIKDGIEDRMEEKGLYQGMNLENNNVLILWDIDGTLMTCGRDGTDALNKTFKDLYDVDNAFSKVKIGTALDSKLMDIMTDEFNIDKNEIPNIIKVYENNLREILEGNENKKAHDGIKEILKWTEEKDYFYNGILTSNYKIGADLKLDSVDLLKHFKIGGYGDEDGEKWDVLAETVKRAEEEFGVKFIKSNIYLVGDTWYDIECSKKCGIKSISVATGWTEYDVLKEKDPDYVFKDLKDLKNFSKIFDE